MKFFIPHAATRDQGEIVYQSIKKFASQQMAWEISDRRIMFMKYSHDSKEYTVEVGEKEKRTGEEVIAILESTGSYLVCTENRGVVRGEPIMIGKHEVSLVNDFE